MSRLSAPPVSSFRLLLFTRHGVAPHKPSPHVAVRDVAHATRKRRPGLALGAREALRTCRTAVRPRVGEHAALVTLRPHNGAPEHVPVADPPASTGAPAHTAEAEGGQEGGNSRVLRARAAGHRRAKAGTRSEGKNWQRPTRQTSCALRWRALRHHTPKAYSAQRTWALAGRTGCLLTRPVWPGFVRCPVWKSPSEAGRRRQTACLRAMSIGHREGHARQGGGGVPSSLPTPPPPRSLGCGHPRQPVHHCLPRAAASAAQGVGGKTEACSGDSGQRSVHGGRGGARGGPGGPGPCQPRCPAGAGLTPFSAGGAPQSPP